MPQVDDDYALLIAAAAQGSGVALLGAAAYQYVSEDKRREFADRLASQLGDDLEVVAAVLGRGAGNVPFWNVTLRRTTTCARSTCGSRPERSPYAPATCAAVAERVLAAAK